MVGQTLLTGSLLFGLMLTGFSASSVFSSRECREKTQVNTAGDIKCNLDITCSSSDVCDPATYQLMGGGSFKLCYCGNIPATQNPTQDEVCSAYVVSNSSGSTGKCMPDETCPGENNKCEKVDPDLHYFNCACTGT